MMPTSPRRPSLRAELAKAQAQLAARNRIHAIMLENSSLSGRLLRILKEIMALVAADYGEIYRLRGRSYHLQVWHGFPPDYLTQAQPLPAGTAFTLAPDLAERFAVQSLACLPITLPLEGTMETLGLLRIGSRRAQAFTEDDWALLRILSEKLALVIDHADQYRQAQERLARLVAVCRVNKAISAAQSPEEVVSAALGRLRLLLNYARASVTLIDGDYAAAGAVLTLTTLRANHQVQQTRGECVLAEYPDFVNLLNGLRQAEPQTLTHPAQLTLPPPLQEGLAANPGPHILLPLLNKTELVGTLNLAILDPQHFTAESYEESQEVADLLAIAIQQVRLHRQVQAGRTRLQALSWRLLETQEAERRRLAQELHDEIGQVLAAVKLSLQTLSRNPAASLPDSIAMIDKALQQVRDLSLELRPSLLDDLGLSAALRWYLDRQAQRAGFSWRLEAESLAENLPPLLQTVCFRVAQEAVTNVTRHAQARQVTVTLRQEQDRLWLTIRDDGNGFNVEEARQHALRGQGMGLLSMHERVLLTRGRLDIRSQPGQGTDISACFPLNPDLSAVERRTRNR